MSKDHQEAMKLWNCHLLLEDLDSPSKAQQQVLQAKLILFITLDSFQKNPGRRFQTEYGMCKITAVPKFYFCSIFYLFSDIILIPSY